MRRIQADLQILKLQAHHGVDDRMRLNHAFSNYHSLSVVLKDLRGLLCGGPQEDNRYGEREHLRRCHPDSALISEFYDLLCEKRGLWTMWLNVQEMNAWLLRVNNARLECKAGMYFCARNGVYVNVVDKVREAFKTDEVVRIECNHVETSDCKKIGVKLRDLVSSNSMKRRYKLLMLQEGEGASCGCLDAGIY